APTKGDHLIDAGGCFGDTALEFAMTIGDQGHVYTFDPIPKHCAIMRENLALNPILAPRISVHEVGLSAVERVGKGQSGLKERSTRAPPRSTRQYQRRQSTSSARTGYSLVSIS